MRQVEAEARPADAADCTARAGAAACAGLHAACRGQTGHCRAQCYAVRHARAATATAAPSTAAAGCQAVRVPVGILRSEAQAACAAAAATADEAAVAAGREELGRCQGAGVQEPGCDGKQVADFECQQLGLSWLQLDAALPPVPLRRSHPVQEEEERTRARATHKRLSACCVLASDTCALHTASAELPCSCAAWAGVKAQRKNSPQCVCAQCEWAAAASFLLLCIPDNSGTACCCAGLLTCHWRPP